MAKISIYEARPGMVLAKPIHNESGVVVLNEGVALTQEHIEKLREMGISQISVKGQKRDLGSLDEALESMEKRFRVSYDKPYMDVIKRALERHLRSLYGGSG